MSAKKRVMMPASTMESKPSSDPSSAKTTSSEVDDVDGGKEGTEEQTDTLTPEQAKDLFTRYDMTTGQCRELEELVKQKSYECSELVKEISEKLGRGPFEWKGSRLLVMRRGETFFFRTEGSKEVRKIG
jgi:hypothetical protein